MKNVLKGIVIGFASIMPGISGGTMAVSMGIYDKLIYAMNHLFSEFKKNLLFLMPILSGMGIAIVASSFGLEYLFEAFPIQTNLLFIGFILGCLPGMFFRVRGVVIRKAHILSMSAFFLLIIGMAVLEKNSNASATIAGDSIGGLSGSFSDMLPLFFTGIIAAATMVIPGVSGSMILLMLGYYNAILNTINQLIIAMLQLDFPKALSEGIALLPFGTGVVFGAFLLARVIEFLFQKYEAHVYWASMGLLLASPAAILLAVPDLSITIGGIITGMVALAGGFLLSKWFGEK